MRRTTLKKAVLAFIFASALPLAACDSDSPTSPTQAGPTVTTPTDTPPTTTTPTPDPTPIPTPTPTPTPPSTTSVSGTVVNLNRGGTDGLDISFRIDDFTIVRAAGSTPVIIGSSTEQTRAISNGMSVTVDGTRSNGFLDATRIVVNSQ